MGRTNLSLNQNRKPKLIFLNNSSILLLRSVTKVGTPRGFQPTQLHMKMEVQALQHWKPPGPGTSQ